MARPKISLNGYNGYVHVSGRNVIYARGDATKKFLSKYNVKVPYEKKNGSRPLKTDLFYNDPNYGSKVTKIWDFIEANPNTNVAAVDSLVKTLFP